jgi:hypothetical protein
MDFSFFFLNTLCLTHNNNIQTEHYFCMVVVDAKLVQQSSSSSFSSSFFLLPSRTGYMLVCVRTRRAFFSSSPVSLCLCVCVYIHIRPHTKTRSPLQHCTEYYMTIVTMMRKNDVRLSID